MENGATGRSLTDLNVKPIFHSMALCTFQLCIPHFQPAHVRKNIKRMTIRKLRRTPITLEDVGGKTARLPTKGWMD